MGEKYHIEKIADRGGTLWVWMIYDESYKCIAECPNEEIAKKIIEALNSQAI